MRILQVCLDFLYLFTKKGSGFEKITEKFGPIWRICQLKPLCLIQVISWVCVSQSLITKLNNYEVLSIAGEIIPKSEFGGSLTKKNRLPLLIINQFAKRNNRRPFFVFVLNVLFEHFILFYFVIWSDSHMNFHAKSGVSSSKNECVMLNLVFSAIPLLLRSRLCLKGSRQGHLLHCQISPVSDVPQISFTSHNVAIDWGINLRVVSPSQDTHGQSYPH